MAFPVSFGDILFEAFMRTNKIEYLNESISTHRQVLSVRYYRSCASDSSWLSMSLFTRSRSFPSHQRTQDLDEALELLSQCVNDNMGACPIDASLHAVGIYCATYPTPSVSTAYESAVSLMQDTLLFAPTLQLQHTLSPSDDFHRMSLDYASYQVDLHQLEEAIVTLERGRALLWSEMRHLPYFSRSTSSGRPTIRTEVCSGQPRP
jgi:hypothetical protein